MPVNLTSALSHGAVNTKGRLEYALAGGGFTDRPAAIMIPVAEQAAETTHPRGSFPKSPTGSRWRQLFGYQRFHACHLYSRPHAATIPTWHLHSLSDPSDWRCQAQGKIESVESKNVDAALEE